MNKKMICGIALVAFSACMMTACGNNPSTSTTSTWTRKPTTYSGDSYKIYMESATNGKLAIADGKGTVRESGTEVKVKATPNQGYEVEKITIVGKTSKLSIFTHQTGTDDEFAFIMPDDEVIFNAYFEKTTPHSEYRRHSRTKQMNALGYNNAVQDETFRKGFSARKKINDGEYQFINPIEVYKWDKKISPDWGITQWMSQSLVDPDTPSFYLNTNETISSLRDKEQNYAKEMKFDTSKGDFSLSCNCIQEYKDNTQERSSGYKDDYWWVHYLLEQTIPASQKVRLSDCDEIVMMVDYAPTSFKEGNLFDFNDDGKTAAAKCAQFEWYVTVQNLNPDSKQYSTYCWFGFDMWDNRSIGKVSGEYKSGEYGSGVRICRPDSRKYISHDSDYKSFDGKLPALNQKSYLKCDSVLSFLRKDYEEQHHQGGYWQDTEWEDLYIASTNIGYEIHNHYDVTFDLSQIGIYYK